MSPSRFLVLTFATISLVLCSAGTIQSQNTAFKLQVLSAVNGLRVQTDLPGGVVGSFGGYGQFQVDAPFSPGGRFAVTEGGHVGIGTANPSSWLHVRVPASASPISAMTVDVDSFSTFSNAQASHFFQVRDIGANAGSSFLIRGDGNIGIGTDGPAEKLTVAGVVESTAGGFRFPDGSAQSTAAGMPGTTYTKILIDPVGIAGSFQSIGHLTLPGGTYLLASTVELNNLVNGSVRVGCGFTGEGGVFGNIAGAANATLSIHVVLTITSGVDVFCSTNQQSVAVRAQNRRITATLLTGGVVAH